MLSRAVYFLGTGIQLAVESVLRLLRQVGEAVSVYSSICPSERSGPDSECVPFSQVKLPRML